MPEPHLCDPENAAKFKAWIATRGGVAIWRSINLSNPGGSWSTPALQPGGQPTTKPTWQAETTPSRIITDPAEILVTVPREVKRFHVAIRMGDSMNLTLTDGASRRVRREVAKAGDKAWYDLDRYTQEAVILVPDREVTLDQWEVTA